MDILEFQGAQIGSLVINRQTLKKGVITGFGYFKKALYINTGTKQVIEVDTVIEANGAYIKYDGYLMSIFVSVPWLQFV